MLNAKMSLPFCAYDMPNSVKRIHDQGKIPVPNCGIYHISRIQSMKEDDEAGGWQGHTDKCNGPGGAATLIRNRIVATAKFLRTHHIRIAPGLVVQLQPAVYERRATAPRVPKLPQGFEFLMMSGQNCNQISLLRHLYH